MTTRRYTRRAVAATAGTAVAAATIGSAFARQATPGASPAASPVGGEWTYTDVMGKTVTLPSAPTRIAANLVPAAALWDLGIKADAVFDWTASAHPDGDHIAWGNIDATAVVNVGDADGNILPEDLLNVHPDVILVYTFDPNDPSGISGVVPDMWDTLNQIAPLVVVTDNASTEVQLQRFVDLAVSLGADVDAPAIAGARDTFGAKVEEIRGVLAEKADLSVIFADVDPDAFYVAGPKDIAELKFLSSLGMAFANADSAEADEFWETLSLEQALKYPADIFYNDVYSTYRTLEELQAQPAISAMPAVQAGQVGEWTRDFPLSYEGVTTFLEAILTPLRDAQRVRPD
ncbi:MAG: ABC transporter substrate-binding protein [Thermomicrobiales bacterium]